MTKTLTIVEVGMDRILSPPKRKSHQKARRSTVEHVYLPRCVYLKKSEYGGKNNALQEKMSSLSEKQQLRNMEALRNRVS